MNGVMFVEIWLLLENATKTCLFVYLWQALGIQLYGAMLHNAQDWCDEETLNEYAQLSSYVHTTIIHQRSFTIHKKGKTKRMKEKLHRIFAADIYRFEWTPYVECLVVLCILEWCGRHVDNVLMRNVPARVNIFVLHSDGSLGFIMNGCIQDVVT